MPCHSQAEPVVVDVREADVSPHVHAVKHLRVRLVVAEPTHLVKKKTVSVSGSANSGHNSGESGSELGGRNRPNRSLAVGRVRQEDARHPLCAAKNVGWPLGTMNSMHLSIFSLGLRHCYSPFTIRQTQNVGFKPRGKDDDRSRGTHVPKEQKKRRRVTDFDK